MQFTVNLKIWHNFMHKSITRSGQVWKT